RRSIHRPALRRLGELPFRPTDPSRARGAVRLRLGVTGRASSRLFAPIIARVALEPVAWADRPDFVLVVDGPGPADLSNYAAGLMSTRLPDVALEALPVPAVHGLETVSHLAAGDVVALHPSGYVRTLYRVASRHNALFATDRCNSLC